MPGDARSVVSALGEHARELTRERLRIPLGRRDDEHGVVTGERAHDPFVLELVERPRDRRRRAELGLEDDDVSRRRHPAPELPQDRVQQLDRIRAPDDIREHVARTAQGIVGLLQSELSYVPRDGRLRDDAAGAGERVQKLELRANPLPGDDAFDQPMALGLAQLHISSIRMQVWWSPSLVEHEVMLRRLLWAAIHGAVAAAAVVVTRRVSAWIWRTLTGEEPPTKK